MALKLRLARKGTKKRPFYRIVAMNSETRRNGRALDFLGYYNPMVEPNDIKLEKDKVQKWMERGATPTETVRSLMKKSGYFDQA